MSENRSLDWDDVIENDGQEFVVLPEGDYVFTVTGVERGWQNSTAKIPGGCNKAVLTLEVKTEEGTAVFNTNLLLCTNLVWRLSAFFRSIGLKQYGEKLVMKWNEVPGRKGMAHIKPRKWTDNNGQERTANDVDRWIDYDAGKMGSVGSGQWSGDPDEDIPF
ncbi:MAG: hypothetical protein II969_11590 [Anaerolineaceae bacterium]|nr:hypothetical protein [Anaerolineaceae bacterium]